MIAIERMYEKQRSIPVELLFERFDYEEDSGILRIKPKSPDEFTGKNKKTKAALWNKKYAGKVAGTEWTSRGITYKKVMIDNVMLPYHQIVWAIHYGEWAFSSLDHIDGRGLNNKITNLRIAEQDVNAKNLKLNKNNKSGLHQLIINTNKTCVSFTVKLIKDGKIKSKTFDNLFDAACFRKSYELHNGYSERHGEVK